MLNIFDQLPEVCGGRLCDLINRELNLMRIFFRKVEQIGHGLLNLRCPRLYMEALDDDISQVLSALAEGPIKVGKFELFHACYISFKLIFNLEFRRLSGESEAAIDAVLIFYLFCLTSKAKGRGTYARDKETTIDKLYRCGTLRAFFVTF